MTVGIHKKPVVDLAAIEKAQLDKEAKNKDKLKKVIEKVEDPELEEEETPEEIAVREAEELETKKDEEKDKKLVASQQEAMVWKKKAEDLEAEKAKVIEVTDEYMKTIYTDWDDMTLGEQRSLKEVEKLKQENIIIRAKANEFNNDRQWTDNVTQFVDGSEFDENFPAIKDRKEDFKRFCNKPTRKGMAMEDLAKIFLYENPTTPVKKKRSLFNAPGGPNKGPAPKKGLTPDEVRLLRVNSPKKYNELVRQHKIKVEI